MLSGIGLCRLRNCHFSPQHACGHRLSGQRGIAVALCWPALGLALASIIIGLLASGEPQAEGDDMTSCLIKNGETADMRRGWQEPWPVSPQVENSTLSADVFERRLHITAWFVSNPEQTESKASGSPSNYCCHGLEAVIDSTRRSDSAGGFVDSFQFDQLWEVTFYGTSPFHLPADAGNLPRLRGLKHLAETAMHHGQRRMDAGELCQAIFAPGLCTAIAGNSKLAFWHVSSLSGKVVRVGSNATDRLSWFQPLHGELFEKEVGWLQAGFSPAVFQHLVAANLGSDIQAYQLAQVLPPDAGLQRYLHQCRLRQVHIARQPGTQQIEIVGQLPAGSAPSATPLACSPTIL